MRLEIQTVDGKLHSVHFNSAGRMRLALRELAELPNKWWEIEVEGGNLAAFNTANITTVMEVTR